MKKLFLFILSGVYVAGCSLMPDRTMDYRYAGSLPRMEVPEDMVFSGEQDLFPIPEAASADQKRRTRGRFEVPPAPRLDVTPTADRRHPGGDPSRSEIRVLMTRDGNGYPIIMMQTGFNWAWERVAGALKKTDIRINDRNRDSGIFFVTVPARYGLADTRAQVKLSHTVNGIQVALLNGQGTALVDKDPGLAVLQRLHDQM